MTVATQPQEFRVRGWLLWLSWAYVSIFSIGTLFGIITMLTGHVFGLEVRGPDVTPWWVLVQLPYIALFVACIGVLLKDRDFAWVAVITSWMIVIIQCVQAVLQLAHLRLSLPLSAVLFAAYAIGLKRQLRPARERVRAGGGLM